MLHVTCCVAKGGVLGSRQASLCAGPVVGASYQALLPVVAVWLGSWDCVSVR